MLYLALPGQRQRLDAFAQRVDATEDDLGHPDRPLLTDVAVKRGMATDRDGTFMASLPLAENAPAGATVTSALVTPTNAKAITAPAMMFLIIIVIPCRYVHRHGGTRQ